MVSDEDKFDGIASITLNDDPWRTDGRSEWIRWIAWHVTQSQVKVEKYNLQPVDSGWLELVEKSVIEYKWGGFDGVKVNYYSEFGHLWICGKGTKLQRKEVLNADSKWLWSKVVHYK